MENSENVFFSKCSIDPYHFGVFILKGLLSNSVTSRDTVGVEGQVRLSGTTGALERNSHLAAGLAPGDPTTDIQESTSAKGCHRSCC